MSVQIPCPQCGLKLKLPDESFLGRKGKCPQCGNKFRLELPAAEKPRAERVASVRVPSAPRPPQPLATGIVVDSGSPPAATHSAIPDFSAANDGGANFVVLPDPAEDLGGMARLKKMQRRSARMRNITLAAVGLMLIGAAGGYAFVRSRAESAGTAKKVKPGSRQTAANGKAKNKPTTEDEDSWDSSLGGDDLPGSTTDREPIELRAVPHGTAITIHLRPSELWKDGGLPEEVRACLGPVATWSGDIIKAYCLAEPGAIEQLLVSVIPGPRGTPPDYSFVVRLKQDAKRSDLVQKFGGELQDEGRPHYLGQ
jgi:hypothetical protein